MYDLRTESIYPDTPIVMVIYAGDNGTFRVARFIYLWQEVESAQLSFLGCIHINWFLYLWW